MSKPTTTSGELWTRLLGATGVCSLYGNRTTQIKTFGRDRTEQNKTKSTQHKVKCSKYINTIASTKKAFHYQDSGLALAWVWQLPSPSKSECGSCQTRVWQLPNPSQPEFGSCQTWGWQRPYLSLAVDTFQTYNAKVQINTHTHILFEIKIKSK